MGMRDKTARDYFYHSHRQMADARLIFVNDILPGITRPEFEALCWRRPEMYEQFRGLVDRKLKGKRR